ncbi:MAG: PilN domain-containing protein [Candidatus Sericytochromatia bacterium]|nr:PilN domain-containing protein [Candidatus Sericytochromatia bacterium]
MTTININLLPEELRDSGGSASSGGGPEIDREALVPIAIGVGVALLLFATPTVLRSAWFEPTAVELAERESEVQAEIDKYNTSLKDLQAQGDRREMLKKQYATLQSVAGVAPSWGQILNELRTLTPGSLWFEDFKVDSGKSEISIKGGALDYGAVAYFQRNLEHSEYFAGPQLRRTQAQVSSGRTSYVQFELTASVRLTARESR